MNFSRDSSTALGITEQGNNPHIRTACDKRFSGIAFCFAFNRCLQAKMELSPEAQLDALKRGAAQIISEEELLAKLRLGRPLNVKLGVDPTAPDIHLGFTVALQKLRQFQDFGHHAVLIIGDFTAMIGDPSGRSATRPQLSHDQVMRNAQTFQQQAFKILDREKTRTVFNGEWLEMLPFDQVIKLASRVTLQPMLQREDFKNPLHESRPV